MNTEILQEVYEEILKNEPDINKIKVFFEQNVKNLSQKKIVIYPAGAMGKLVKKTLGEYNIDVDFYIDRAADVLIKIEEIPVFNIEKLKNLNDEYIVIVAANMNSQQKELIGIVSEYNNKLNVINGYELNRVLRYPVCTKKLKDGNQFDIIQCENCGFERHGCSICLSYLKNVAKFEELENDWRSEKFDWFGYIVGQSCTLNCIHCCEAVPFLKGNNFVPVDVIISDVKKVAESSKFLTFVELIGGEPFLHPDFKKLLEGLLKIKNIGYIKSFTNGTIVPSDDLCEVLKNPRFMLQLSNYEKQATGKLLENIFATRKKLKDSNVNYIFSPVFEWQDFSSFDLHNTDEVTLKKVFEACPLRNCHRLYKGELFRCPHQYAGIQLEKLNKTNYDLVDINQYDEKNLATALEAFESIEYVDACKYCKLPFDAPVVPAAIQLKD